MRSIGCGFVIFRLACASLLALHLGWSWWLLAFIISVIEWRSS